jgi:hypothetical protein
MKLVSITCQVPLYSLRQGGPSSPSFPFFILQPTRLELGRVQVAFLPSFLLGSLVDHQTGFTLALGSSGYSSFLTFRFPRSNKVGWTSPLRLVVKNFAMAKEIRSRSSFFFFFFFFFFFLRRFGIELGM